MSANQIGFVSAITDIDTTARDTPGSIRYDVNGVYKYVQFGATRTTNLTGALAAGDIACYVLGTTADLDLMTLADSANSAVGAGLVMAAVAATGGPFYGWLKVIGIGTLSGAPAGSPSAGDDLTNASASAKALTKVVTDAAPHVATLVDATNFVVQLHFSH